MLQLFVKTNENTPAYFATLLVITVVIGFIAEAGKSY
jgi:hypothetical protein